MSALEKFNKAFQFYFTPEDLSYPETVSKLADYARLRGRADIADGLMGFNATTEVLRQ